MIHTALARKYRPRRFGDLIGQPHVTAGLAGAVARNRVAHAYLLAGPRGVGKTSAARILAMALNCEERTVDGEPCGRCDSCHRIWSGNANLDVVEIDAASNRGVDDARELRERAMYAASGPERHKIYIIDEAHMLTREAWNALLKILEEPPPQVVFVFATTEPQKIANTAAPVLSRLQRFDFRRVGPQAIAGRLSEVAEAEGLSVDADAMTLIARVAGGGVRDALSLLDQATAFGDGGVSAAKVRESLGLIDDELYAEMLAIVGQHRSADVFPFVARIAESGADLAEFVTGAGEVLRSLLLAILGNEPEGLTESLRVAVHHHAASYGSGDVVRMLKLLAEAETAVRRSPNARMYVETLLLEWALLDRTVELEQVLRALERGTGSPSEPPWAEPQPTVSASPSAAAPQTPAAAARDAAAWTVDAARGKWSQLLQSVASRRRILREALSHASPIGVDGDQLILEVADSAVHLEGLERGRDIIEAAAGALFGRRVWVTFRSTGRDAEQTPPTAAPQRLDREGDREERLRAYRKKDPALDAVADALDLELLE